MIDIVTLADIIKVSRKPITNRLYKTFIPTDMTITLKPGLVRMYPGRRIYIEGKSLYIVSNSKPVYLDDFAKNEVSMANGFKLPEARLDVMTDGEDTKRPIHFVSKPRIDMGGSLKLEHIDTVKPDDAGDKPSPHMPDHTPTGYSVIVHSGYEGMRNKRRRIYVSDTGMWYIVVKGERMRIEIDALVHIQTLIEIMC